MSEQEPIPEHLDRLGGEAKSVLAVLVLAALWPSRYPGGWVSVREFAQAGALLGERADQESLKSAIRRGLRKLGQVRGAPKIECRRTHEHDPVSDRLKRDRDRRLAEPVGPELEGWLLRVAPEVVAVDLWRHFFPGRNLAADQGRSAARDLLRQSLRQAEACLGFAALAIPPRSPEALALRRIRKSLIESIQAIAPTSSPGGKEQR